MKNLAKNTAVRFRNESKRQCFLPSYILLQFKGRTECLFGRTAVARSARTSNVYIREHAVTVAVVGTLLCLAVNGCFSPFCGTAAGINHIPGVYKGFAAGCIRRSCVFSADCDVVCNTAVFIVVCAVGYAAFNSICMIFHVFSHSFQPLVCPI